MSSRINVARMRRYVERDQEDREGRERAAWIASLPAEHRRHHERKPGQFPSLICPFCLHASMAPIRRMNARAAERRSEEKR